MDQSSWLVLAGTIITNLVILLNRGESLAKHIFDKQIEACQKVVPQALELLEQTESYLRRNEALAEADKPATLKQAAEELWATLKQSLVLPESVGVEIERVRDWCLDALDLRLPLAPDSLEAKLKELHDTRLAMFRRTRDAIGVDMTKRWISRIASPLRTPRVLHFFKKRLDKTGSSKTAPSPE